MTAPLVATRLAVAVLTLVASLAASGCSVMAAPCRISAAVVKTVPVAGKVAALPLDACAEVID